MRKLADWLFSLNVRTVSIRGVESEYFHAASIFSEAVDGIIFGGRCIGFKRLYLKWKRWEREWARRGCRPMPLEWFSERVALDLETLQLKYVDNRLQKDESPIFFADEYYELAFSDE